jgi:hypothetical protein
MFVCYVQPLARPKKCLALHNFPDAAGKAGPDVQRVLNDICKAFSQRNIKVRYVCSDDDSGYNRRHHEIVKKWPLAYLTGGLCAVLTAIAGEDMILITNFLHLLKNFCNKMKNHPVTICSELPEDILICQDLESLLYSSKFFPINRLSAGCVINML